MCSRVAAAPRAVLAIVVLVGLPALLGACGGGGGGSSTAATSSSSTSGSSAPYASLAEECAVPRPAGTINPLTGEPYGDVQGSLTTEKAWIHAWVNDTYLWYADVPNVDASLYVVGATVPYVDPTDNSSSTETLETNYDVVDAYFNSQRSPLFTASGKPKDQFHFTYTTTVWDALESSGSEAGFGFDIALVDASPPRLAYIAYVQPGTTAATHGLQRGLQVVSVNGVDFTNDDSQSAVATINAGLFSPVTGTAYTFVFVDPQTNVQSTVTLTASNITTTPVLTSGVLPAPNSAVGYILFNEHVATAESELIAAVTSLQAANNGQGIQDLVLDIRYNGGGLLDIASELAYMIAGPGPTAGKAFEVETYNNKNPFGYTLAEDTTPFHTTTQGFSTVAGNPLPELGLSRVFVLTGPDTCSASEAIINSLRGVGVSVIQIGHTTCGKPYGFFPQDNCSTTYFTIQFEGVNAAGFGAYADGFIPAGTGTTANNLPGCMVADDFTKALGDPSEARLAAALQYRSNQTCPAPSAAFDKRLLVNDALGRPLIVRSALHQNRFLRPH